MAKSLKSAFKKLLKEYKVSLEHYEAIIKVSKRVKGVCTTHQSRYDMLSLVVEDIEKILKEGKDA